MPETIFASPLEFLAACLILVAAQFVYVLFGFGAGLIAVGSLALLIPDIRDVVVLLLLVNLPAETAVVAASRRIVRWRAVVHAGAGVVAGIPLGTILLRAIEPVFLLSLLGGVLVAVGALFLALPRRGRSDWPSWTAPPVGLAAGVLTGLFGTGGPPLIVYYHLTGLGKAAFRGQLMALFLLMTLVRVPSYVVGGLVTGPRLMSGLALLPAVAIGAWLGHRVHVTIGEVVFRRLVSVLLLCMGALLLLRT
ncbi:MAG: sulfite exporter TauE/SafE family protein [Candidatus Krumholzibacteriia bacterium]